MSLADDIGPSPTITVEGIPIVYAGSERWLVVVLIPAEQRGWCEWAGDSAVDASVYAEKLRGGWRPYGRSLPDGARVVVHDAHASEEDPR